MQIPQLTFTRFLASVSIVILHFGLFTWPINSDLVFPVMEKSISAISYFFVLSGFILVISTSKNGILPEEINTKLFWKKRAARILPIYLFSILLFFAINFRYDSSISLIWQIQSYVYSLFLVQSWNYKLVMDVNFPAWSLSVEALFYFVFPWLYLLLHKLMSSKLILIALLVWILNSLLFLFLTKQNYPENFSKFFPLFHLATFITGMCSGILFLKHYSWLSGKGKKYLFGLTALISIFLIYSAYANWKFYEFQHNGLLSPVFILLFYSLAIMKGKIKSVLSAKPLVFLGDISFSIYLFQFPVLQICQKYLPWFEGKETKDIFFQYLIVLICFSSITYLLIEKPLRRYFSGKNLKLN